MPGLELGAVIPISTRVLEVPEMRMMSRYWMTGCMAIVLLAANQWTNGQDDEDAPTQRRGLIAIGSRYPMEQTVSRLAEAARSRGFALIAQVKRPAQAESRESSGDDAQVLVFGTPDGHTPVLQAANQESLDLPLKMIVRSHADGTSTVLFVDPDQLAARADLQDAGELADELAALPAVVGEALG
ncbi:MAG: DUF302 domain-containing protein [Aquabacterium sp.]|jgi:uncharacterized protein (DUF302 family)|nr:MAG: DUF302 domain-containing protein [Aquabacterium sp.]